MDNLPSNDQIARWLDPEQIRKEWWWKVIHCPSCGANDSLGQTYEKWICHNCGYRYEAQEDSKFHYCFKSFDFYARPNAWLIEEALLDHNCRICRSANNNCVDILSSDNRDWLPITEDTDYNHALALALAAVMEGK